VCLIRANHQLRGCYLSLRSQRVLMDGAVFHNPVAAGRDQRPAGFERSREVGQRGSYTRFARRQVISIFFSLHPAPHPITRSLGDQFARWTSTFGIIELSWSYMSS